MSLEKLLDQRLHIIGRGKVRNTYALKPDRNRNLQRLVWVSDRISIFDFVLGFEVEGKGAILNAFNIAARLYLKDIMPALKHDLIAFGAEIDAYLPKSLRNNPALQRTAVVVRSQDMIKVEAVVRGYLTGSGYAAYAQQKPVCGHDIEPKGQPNGFKLERPLFTPTTKARKGHDEPLDYRDVERKHEFLGSRSVAVYDVLFRRSWERGVIGADTKFEWSEDLVLCDEVWTPDSSRFWSKAEYDDLFPRELPGPMDKQAIRLLGKEWGIDKLDPKNPHHCKAARVYRATPMALNDYRQRTRTAFEMLWSKSIPTFQREVMGIK